MNKPECQFCGEQASELRTMPGYMWQPDVTVCADCFRRCDDENDFTDFKLTKGANMQTIDEKYRDLADRAQQQCEALGDQFSALIDAEDEDGEPVEITMDGVRTEADGRRVIQFSEADVPNGRTVVYVDAILALADLIRRERVVEGRA